MRTLDVRKDLRTVLMMGAFLVLANAAAYGLFIRPRIIAFHDLETSGDKFKKDLSEAEKTVKTLTDYHDKLKATQDNIEEFYDKILGTKQEKLISVQQEVVEIGSNYRINPDVVSLETKDIEDNGLEQFSIRVPVEGDYADLRNFIAKLESSKSFIIIEGISLTGTKEGGLTLQMQIQLTTYFNAPWLKETRKTKGSARRG